MGKYMRKSTKTTVGVSGGGEMSLMELGGGVITRAKTKTLMALKRLERDACSSPGGGSANSGNNSSCYLQLRSRRLEKPPLLPDTKRQRKGNLGCSKSGNGDCCYNTRARAGRASSSSGMLRAVVEEKENKEEVKREFGIEEKVEDNGGRDVDCHGGDLGVEDGCFGENCLDLDGRERSTRESTPCSLIRNPDAIRTPGSTTRPSASADTNRVLRNETQRRIPTSNERRIPTSNEMDEFFAGAEEQQQKEFIEKYNFDPVNDKPLPGRYEWVKVDPKKA